MTNDIESRLYKFMTPAEEAAYFHDVCELIINNPRYYLDNLETLNVFRVSWMRYKGQNILKNRNLYK